MSAILDELRRLEWERTFDSGGMTLAGELARTERAYAPQQELAVPLSLRTSEGTGELGPLGCVGVFLALWPTSLALTAAVLQGFGVEQQTALSVGTWTQPVAVTMWLGWTVWRRIRQWLAERARP